MSAFEFLIKGTLASLFANGEKVNYDEIFAKLRTNLNKLSQNERKAHGYSLNAVWRLYNKYNWDKATSTFPDGNHREIINELGDIANNMNAKRHTLCIPREPEPLAAQPVATKPVASSSTEAGSSVERILQLRPYQPPAYVYITEHFIRLRSLVMDVVDKCNNAHLDSEISLPVLNLIEGMEFFFDENEKMSLTPLFITPIKELLATHGWKDGGFVTAPNKKVLAEGLVHIIN